MGCASGKWGSELCLDTEAGLAWAAGQPALKFAEGTAPPAALKPWPGASLQGHPWLPRPLPPPGASLGSSQQELLLAISHGCFFLPHSFKIGSGEWALGEDPQITGYVLAVHTPMCFLTLWFLGWIMGSELGPEETWVLSDSSLSFHRQESRSHPGATDGGPCSVPPSTSASRFMNTQLRETALSPFDRGRG